jgi:hypothetical protein
VINVGDSVINRYLAGSNIGVAGGTVNVLTGGVLFKNTAETEIQIGIGTGGTGAPAGTIDLYLTGFIDN